jgi:hypothetical protein
MHSSADHRRVDGQLERSRKNVSVRGLNRNCNHDLKNLFKGAAAVASSKPGPFREFCTAFVAKGMRPEMARLTLARVDAQYFSNLTAVSSRLGQLVEYCRSGNVRHSGARLSCGTEPRSGGSQSSR